MSIRIVAVTLLVACSQAPEATTDTEETQDTSGSVDTDTAPTPEDTSAQLEAFYTELGGRESLPTTLVDPVEALLHAQDDVVRGDFESAGARVDAIFEAMPLYDDVWRASAAYEGRNVGDPVAYYGLRMLDLIARAGEVPDLGTVQMTAVVAPCATVSRPTLPDLTPETIELDIHPDILADNARILHQSTDLFRHYLRAITGGVTVDLEVVVLSDCTTVDYTDDGSVVRSYPDSAAMIEATSPEVRAATDLWWVVAPSGVPGDGSGYGRHFITGGMGGHGMGQPLFLSDDAWFVRKPEHLGSGSYSEVERRVYQPQWFQHEYLHHLFRTWPEFGLEDSDHQWFDRGTWPADFEGRWEPDYYYEAVTKRLAAATPSLAQAIDTPDPRVLSSADLPLLPGRYVREPVLNDWHLVTVTTDGTGLRWRNDAGVSWGLTLTEGGLWTGTDCPYGVGEVPAEFQGGEPTALWFGGERYGLQPAN